MNLTNTLIQYQNSNDVFGDASSIIRQVSDITYRSVNVLLIQRNWLLGKRIATEELKDGRKENYGKEIIVELSKKLSSEFGKGFEKASLYRFVPFYKTFPNIFSSMMRQSFLSWTHYLILLQVYSKEARDWYEKEAIEGSWSVRTLQRNVDSEFITHRLDRYTA